MFSVPPPPRPFRAYSKGEESAAKGVHQTSSALSPNSAQLFSRRQSCEIAVEPYFNDRQPEVDELRQRKTSRFGAQCQLDDRLAPAPREKGNLHVLFFDAVHHGCLFLACRTCFRSLLGQSRIELCRTSHPVT